MFGRVGITLWHFLEEDQGVGRCYYGTVKTLRSTQCIVEYDRAERLSESPRAGGAQRGQECDSPGSCVDEPGGWNGTDE